MIRILFLLVLLLASVLLGIQLRHDPGYVLISINEWIIESTLWFTLLGLILFFFILHALLILFTKIVQSPISLREWRCKRKLQKAQAKTRQGLIEFSEGYWSHAKNHLIRALPDTDLPLLNYLTAARAAQEMGDHKMRDSYLRAAQQSMPDAKIAVELTQAQLQLANKQWEQALATLRHLQDIVPNHPYVLKLLMYLYQEIHDWPQLIALLPALKNNRVLDKLSLKKVQHKAFIESLMEFKKINDHQGFYQLIQILPKELIKDPDVVSMHASFLMEQNEESKAEALLKQNLKNEINDQLIDLYGQLNLVDKTLPFAESLLKKHPHNASVYLCIGRLSLKKNIWGKAKTAFEQSIKLNPTPQAFEELGHLQEMLKDVTSACESYRKGLGLIHSKKNSYLTD